MPGCDEKTFQLFLFYLVEKSLPEFKTADEVREYFNDERLVEAVAFARLWVFADFQLFPKLQDVAMGYILVMLTEHVSVSMVKYAYGNSIEGSLLRKVVVAEVAHEFIGGYWSPDHEQEDFEGLALVPGYLLDFANCLRDGLKSGCSAPCEGRNDSEYMVGEKEKN